MPSRKQPDHFPMAKRRRGASPVERRAKPGKTWLSKVEPGNRVELPLALAEEVDWITSEGANPIDALVCPLDELAGVQLLPAARADPDTKEEIERDFDALVERIATSVQLSAAEELQSERLLASRWAVSIEVRKRSFRMTLPKEARRLKLLPDYPGAVVIFAHRVQNRVELWAASTWLENLLACKGLLSDKIDEYLGKLASRTEE